MDTNFHEKRINEAVLSSRPSGWNTNKESRLVGDNKAINRGKINQGALNYSAFQDVILSIERFFVNKSINRK